ncbi:MAG: aminotransferase class I/II-fold pyridoxal phosphate-dependent enzyme [Cryomorphaceae bacterium]|nr:aminotransferase class I/II-fold pyridoxal phosphate-dependent enzyme [Cryomorphaceae bacterium]
MANLFWQYLSDKLEVRAASGLKRQLQAPLRIDFSSNDYLGLASRPLETNLVQSGAGASRLISGNHAQLVALEQYLSVFYRCRQTVVFESGYSANHTLFSALAQQGVGLLYDELVHASIRDGLVGARAKTWAFKHNDITHLEKLLLKIQGPVAVVTEGLFSMDGDFGHVGDIATLKNRYDFALIVDEAHTTGWRGPNNLGQSDFAGAIDDIDIRIHTFGKALGGAGACLAAQGELREFLVNYGRPLIYSTAISPAHCEHIRAAHERILMAAEERKKLKDVILLFNAAIQNKPGFYGDLQSPIRFFSNGDLESLKKLAENLKSQDIDARLILSPTVPIGQERIRICLHQFNTKQEIDLLVSDT